MQLSGLILFRMFRSLKALNRQSNLSFHSKEESKLKSQAVQV